MTLHDDTAAKDALIAHLERELKEARETLRDRFAIAYACAGMTPDRIFILADNALRERKK